MFRYLIVVGDPRNESDVAAINEVRRRLHQSSIAWQSAVDRPGFYAAYVANESSADFALELHDQRGVIFGKLYPTPDLSGAATPKIVRSVSRDESEEIVRSMGRTLISRYWGHYVVALHYPEKLSALVMRSPVSPLACFHMRLETLSVFFSYFEDCAALRLTAFSVNWDSITAQVIGGDYLTHETAIKEVDAVECGESVECLRGDCIKRVYWNPQTFLADRSLGSFSEATRAIRDSVDYCANAFSIEHHHILVCLSGGLDSSIVLSGLARSSHKPTLTAVNYHSRGCGDERLHARRMAGSVKCRLVEHARNDQLDLRRFYECNLTIRPVLNFSAPDAEARNTALARELNATAIFDGELGDNVFGRNPDPGALLECIRRNGFGRRYLSVAMDYAMMSRQSFWRTLALTRREALSVAEFGDFSALRKLQGYYGLEAASSLMLASAEAERHHASMAERFLHPWLKQLRRLAPDSHKLLFGLIAVTSPARHSPFGRPDDPPQVSPLISQPVVEAALKIPGYLHCRSAQDRAVARTAFADVLPTEILNRGSGKGGPDLWAKDVVERNTEFLREFLLDGVLVRRGLLDRTKVDSALSPRIAKSTAMVGDIFAKLYIEAWVHRFQRMETSHA
jgi:asparagine synthase (glutamine-hydrolysing)